jgi:hypothetical protein
MLMYIHTKYFVLNAGAKNPMLLKGVFEVGYLVK